jgi:sulfite reductase alpha subunit-like flavoprotein
MFHSVVIINYASGGAYHTIAAVLTLLLLRYHGNSKMMKTRAKSIAVLYASETGTAEDIAYGLFDTIVGARQSTGIEEGTWDVTVSALDQFDYLNVLPTLDVAVFIVSTTGDGDPPMNMKHFWNFLLRRSLPRDALKGVKAAVFGLGDSSYEKYNAAAR